MFNILFQGPQGIKGSIGLQGPVGEQGVTGAIGQEGPKGDTGSVVSLCSTLSSENNFVNILMVYNYSRTRETRLILIIFDILINNVLSMKVIKIFIFRVNEDFKDKVSYLF